MSRSASPSGSEDLEEPEIELLVTGREKRATAGNRLRSLLDVEEILNDDDDDDNIFAEFEDDEEFVSDEEDESENEDEDEDEADVNDAKNKEQQDDEIESGQSPPPDQAAPDDEMFSDSSEDEDDLGPAGAPGEDSDEGERELQNLEKLERARKRKIQEHRTIAGIPVKRHAPTLSSIAPESKKRVMLAQLPHGPVRSSKRSITIKNKEEVQRRLEEQAQRRASLPTPQVKEKKKQITQEERIERAKLIETRNVASLHKFFEQEVERKKSLRAAFLAQRRVQLGPYVRWRSIKSDFPVDEQRAIVEIIAGDGRRSKQALPERDSIDIPKQKRKYKKRVKKEVQVELSNQEAAVPLESENAVKQEDVDGKEAKSILDEKTPTNPDTQAQSISDESETKLTKTSNPDIINQEPFHQLDIPTNSHAREDNNATEVVEYTSAPVSPMRPIPSASPLKKSLTPDDIPENDLHSDTQVNSEITGEFTNGIPDVPVPNDVHPEVQEVVKDVEAPVNQVPLDDYEQTQPETEKEAVVENHLVSVTQVKPETKNDSCAQEPPITTETQENGLEDEQVQIHQAPDSQQNNEDHNLQDFKDAEEDEDQDDGETKISGSVEPLARPEEARSLSPDVPKAPGSIELLSFMDFPTVDAPTVRTALFGPQAVHNRPPATTQRHLCPITGLPASLRDPLTGIRYANLEAFRIMRAVLSGGIPWNAEFGEGMYYNPVNPQEWEAKKIENADT
ncbi:YL1 nuclear protein-domain-containing protein [Lipomyces japonicus]|uniref:YL1 nuclear protein-domain-containing protein n=1 Tax=Lipomyces japonicus TaxID=56871 RepID=UPI0034CFC9AF